MQNNFVGKKILITGGTGTVGSELVRQLLPFKPKVIRIFSRDEAKQFDMAEKYCGNATLRFLLGDVRDETRLKMAFQDIDLVFHCAGLKHVKSCEYNPFEAVKTNVIGTQNVINQALEHTIEALVFCSTDKAVNASNAMGASKLMAERLITAANNLRGSHRTRLFSTRFGNVMGSRGSVIPTFLQQIAKGGPVTLTDRRMTRFVMTLEQATQLTLKASTLAKGGEVFIPKMQAIHIADLAEIVIEELAEVYGYRPSQIKITEIGLQPGERLHEAIMTAEEADRVLELDDLYVVYPDLMPMNERMSVSKYPGQEPKQPIQISSAEVQPLSKEAVRDFLFTHRLIPGEPHR